MCKLFLVLTLAFHGVPATLASLPQNNKPFLASRPRHYYFAQHTTKATSPSLVAKQDMLDIPRGGSTTTYSDSNNPLILFVSHWSQNPFVVAAVICATKAGLADLVAQKRQGQHPFHVRRSVSFILYGALYQGMVQELIYNNLYTYMFGSGTTLDVVLRKVLFDAIFHNALVCIPMAYVVKAAVFGKPPLSSGLSAYIDDVLHHGLLLKYYAMWMPVNAVLFTVVPPRGRIPVMACVSFFWMILLSTMASRPRKQE